MIGGLERFGIYSSENIYRGVFRRLPSKKDTKGLEFLFSVKLRIINERKREQRCAPPFQSSAM